MTRSLQTDTMFKTINITFIVLFLSVHAKLQIYISDTPVQRIGPRLYKKELLTNKFKDPKELSYDSATRNLFFMYMDDDIGNSGRALINVVTKEAMKIKGIEKNKATAVDPDTGVVYFGTENGLYRYDPLTNEAFNIGLYNVNIMKLVIRNNEMYLIDANNHRIYKVFNEGRKTVLVGNANSVMALDVDDDRNIHYVTMCGLFCAVDRQEVVKNTDLNSVYNFIVSNGKVYGVKDSVVYEIECKNGTAKRVADLDFSPTSIIFGDYGDIYYTIDDNIYKLHPISTYNVYNLKKRHH